MLKTLRSFAVAAVVVASTAAGASAADEPQPFDGRLAGFARADGTVGKVVIDPPRGGATAWFILGGLGIVIVGVMCKAGKRSHLD